MNKIFAALFCITSTTMISAEETKKETPAAETLVGFSIIPNTNWNSGQFVSYKDYLKFDFDSTAFTTYEGSLWHNKTGLKFGVSADVDNNFVGKVNKVIGYLGYKKLFLRVQNSKLRGTATWNGPATAGQPGKVEFDSKYSGIDLLYWKKAETMGGLYFGIGYNSFSLPVQLNAEVYNGKDVVYAKAVYQDQVDFKIYSAMFGFDTMTTEALSQQKGFGFWAYSQDKIGFGPYEINPEGKRRIEAANPGYKLKTNKLTAATVDYDATLGLMWKTDIYNASLSLGAGYNVSGMVIFSFGGSVVNDSSHVSPDPAPYLYRTGPVFRAMLRW